MLPSTISSQRGSRGRLRDWTLATAIAALVMTAVDSLLLEARRSFFTGGFLSVDHLSSPLHGLLFLATSFIIDAAALGILLGVFASGLLRAGLPKPWAISAGAALALVPLLIADLVEYQVLTYFGDAFDLGLMFDLVGRDPREIVAVASPQLVLLAGIALAIIVATALAWRALRGWARRRGYAPAPVRMVRLLGVAAGLLAAGGMVTLAARTGDAALDNGIRRKPSGRVLSAVVNTISDVDRDGAGILGRPPDPAPFDGAVRPYATETAGDGVDQNGVGGDLPSSLPPYRERTYSGPWLTKPDVVLIVLESFRADAIGATSGGRPVTPVLDALARDGISSSRAYSHNGYTVQSRRHLFTGSTAGLERPTTLLDDFKAQGYQTAYFSGQDESFGGPAQGVGFERADVAYDARVDRERRYSTFTTAGSLAVSHEVLNTRVQEFLSTRVRRPLFLYVNFHDTHFPYHHPELQPIAPGRVVSQSEMKPSGAGDLRAMYLNAAANVDRAIGVLLTNVEASLGHAPGVIVLADHGESLFEEGFLGHGYALNDAQTRIPLIVSGLPLAIEEPFGQSDLRGIIHEAFASGESGTTPVLRQVPEKRVFQYLGNVETAAQIGFVGLDGRTLYDLRSREARIEGETWRKERDLTTARRPAVAELVHLWERMVLARRGT